MNQRRLITSGVIIFLGFILVLSLSSSIFLTIDAGEKGVLFKPFSGGLDKERVYEPGFHIKAPWNQMFTYSIREAQLEEEMEVLSSNGLNIKVDVTVRVNPSHNDIASLHEKFGESYANSLVRPEVRSAVRKVIGQFNPEELYSTKRDEVQTLIQEDLSKKLQENYVELRATLIRDIELPSEVRAAIENKIKAEQTALTYEYILEQEKKEAERKIIEAEAKAEANRILNASLTNNILRDKGIEATLELANSPNSKVVVVGGGDEGLPLILGN
ncbi:MAG: prohibitin family protein [Bacteroidota bacterium]